MTSFKGIVTVQDPLNQGTRGLIDSATNSSYMGHRPFNVNVSQAMHEVYIKGKSVKGKNTQPINLNNYDDNTAKYIKDFIDYIYRLKNKLIKNNTHELRYKIETLL